MKRSNSVYFSFAVMAVSLLFGHLNADAFDACRNVSFRIKNSTGRAIDIKKVKYYNLSEARWETESVKNGSERCNNGQTCELQREDLNGAENDRITKVKFIYKEVNSNIERESNQFEPTDPVCRAEKVFGYGQGWTLTLAASTATSGGGSCEDVRFKFTNGHSTDIRIENVQYFMGGRWRTETISSNGGVMTEGNRERRFSCPPGETCGTVDVQTAFDDPNRNRMTNPFDLGGAITAGVNATGVTNAGYGSNLGDADGADITQIKFGYKNRETENLFGVNQKWSAMKTSPVFRPTSPRCSDGRMYGEGQRWTIGSGGQQNSASGNSGTPTLTQSSNPIPGQNMTPGRGGAGSASGGNSGGNDSASPNGGGRRKKGAKNSTEPNVDVIAAPDKKPARKKGSGRKEKGAANPTTESDPALGTEPTQQPAKPKAKAKVKAKAKAKAKDDN